MSQTYDNHVYRPVATGVGYLFVLIALIALALRWFGIGGRVSFAVGLFAILAALATLLLTSRSYITRLQDRIIKLEMRLRIMALVPADRQRELSRLTNKQIAALRFASDGELPKLLDRALAENLKPAEIKRAITTWVADLDRT